MHNYADAANAAPTAAVKTAARAASANGAKGAAIATVARYAGATLSTITFAAITIDTASASKSAGVVAACGKHASATDTTLSNHTVASAGEARGDNASTPVT